MKLWIVSNCRPNSGWGTYTANLYFAVGDIARFLNLFGPSNPGECVGENALISENSRIKPVLARSFPKLYFHSLLQNIREERKVDLVIHYAYNLLPPIGDRDIDIITIHDLVFLSKWYSNEPKYRSLYSKRLLKRYLGFKNIITVSNDVKKKLSLISDSKEIEVIYPPCPPSFKRLEVTDSDKKKLNLPTDKILILSPSNAKPWKNLDIVSRVMKKLGDKFVLVRVGPEIGIGITFSQVDMNILNLLYNVCDILLFPSLEEGFGFPLVEAMRTGLPAVVSDIDVFHEIAADAVEYVNPYDVDSVVEGIFRALDKSEELRKISSRRSELFSMEIFRNKMITFYERVGRNIISKG